MFNLIRNTNSIFDDFFTEISRPNHKIMSTDIKEDDQGFTLLMDLPGFKKEDLKISLLEGLLTVEVERNNEIEDKNDNYIRRERSYGKYSRSFKIGNASLENIDAKFEDGLLTLFIPKSEKETRKYLEVK